MIEPPSECHCAAKLRLIRDGLCLVQLCDSVSFVLLPVNEWHPDSCSQEHMWRPLSALKWQICCPLQGSPVAAADLIAHYRSHNVHHDSIQAPSLSHGGEMGTFGGFMVRDIARSPISVGNWADPFLGCS